MWVQADQVAVQGAHGPLLHATSLRVSTGELAIVHGEPNPGVSAFGLALAGRMRPSTGTVTAGGFGAEARLRDAAAVVDAPEINSPDEALPLRVVVGEELALAGQPARSSDVADWLAGAGLAGSSGQRFESIDAAIRTWLLTELAATRPGVRLLILDRPDRHTAEVSGWAELARGYAARGFAVVVLTATAAPAHMPTVPAVFGAREQPEPLRCQPDEPAEPAAVNTDEQELS